jgi:hypothetical protein
MRSDTELWRFDTANLAVVLTAEPEDLDPTDHFDDLETVEGIRSEKYEWFCAKVAVWTLDDGGDLQAEIGADYLGACCYYSYRDFYTSHRDPNPLMRNCTIMRARPGCERTSICHYFPDMVREAVRAARVELARLKSIPVRRAA